MVVLRRHVAKIIQADLKEKMVLLAGPRQSGKTTLAKGLQKKLNGSYYNWDIAGHRKLLRNNIINEQTKFWIFDEIHKNRGWRNWLKGIYDEFHEKHSILVTGSAKLEIYSHGGDSLQGRYFFHRIHPFTLSEILQLVPPKAITSIFELPVIGKKNAQEALKDLLDLGGFPEPFLSSSMKKASRWRLNYADKLIREEIATLQNLRDLDRLELLYDRLHETVGSVLSINSLKEDLEVAFETVKNWLNIFENIYAVFRISPFGPPKIKAVKKEQKLYFWDWGGIEDRASRFENLVAFHLLRFQHWCEDVEGEKVELRYYRDVRGHEVDFVLLKKRKPWVAIEVKTGEKKLDSGLKYLLERIKFPYAFQISLDGKNDFAHKKINGCNIRVLPASQFLPNLP